MTETRRPATFKDLLNKPARVKDVTLAIPDGYAGVLSYRDGALREQGVAIRT